MILPKIQIVHTIPDDGTIRIQENLMIPIRSCNDGFQDTGNYKRIAGVASLENSLKNRAIWLSYKYNWAIGALPNDEYIYLVPTLK